MLRSLRFAALFGGLILSASALAVDIDAASYGYTLTNPFEATIATTPPELRPELPSNEDINQQDRSVRLRPEREFSLPDNFWPVKKLTYRIATQDHAAPLIFLIAGTGARYDSSLNEYLKKLYYKAGYHVVQLSSPTSFDFISAASRFATPGITKEDAEDMYRVMQAVRAQNPTVPACVTRRKPRWTWAAQRRQPLQTKRQIKPWPAVCNSGHWVGACWCSSVSVCCWLSRPAHYPCCRFWPV